MNIYDTIMVNSVEVGDQILIDGDPIEVTEVGEDVNDADGVIIKGFSHDSGDTATYEMPWDYEVSLWAV